MERIIETVYEILSRDPNAAGLAINWQCFGSNGHQKADYSRGVLERFTWRAPDDLDDSSSNVGNTYKKTVDNPRLIRYRINPHFAFYLIGKVAVNSDGKYIPTWYGNKPILTDKIVINHYYTKSKEEYALKKMPKGSCVMNKNPYNMKGFFDHDRNEIFDDGILKYRAARAENFTLANNAEKFSRIEKSLIETLTQYSPFNVPEEFLIGKLETFLTCRAVAEKLQVKIGERSAEEFALAWIYQTLVEPMTYAEIQQLLKALPEILSRPFQICKRINDFTRTEILPLFCESLKMTILRRVLKIGCFVRIYSTYNSFYD